MNKMDKYPFYSSFYSNVFFQNCVKKVIILEGSRCNVGRKCSVWVMEVDTVSGGIRAH